MSININPKNFEFFKHAQDISSKILLILLLITPLGIISGPFLSDLFISLSALFFIFISIKNKLKEYFYNAFSISFFIWCFYLILLSLFSKNPYLSLESSLFYFRFGIFAIAIWFAIERFKNFLFIFGLIFFITYFFVIFDGYFQFLFGFDIFGLKSPTSALGSYRISGIFGDELVLGSYLSRFLPFLVYFIFIIFEKNKNLIILFSLSAIFFSSILIFLSGERSAFLYFIITIFIFIFFIKKYRIYFLSIFCTIIFLTSLLYFVEPRFKERMFDYTIKQTNIFGDKIHFFSVQHQVIYETAFKIFKDNYIFGIGPKMFREICKKKKYISSNPKDLSVDGCENNPHNFYIQLLAETGLVGSMPFILVFFGIIYLFFKHINSIFIRKKPFFDEKQICLLTTVFITFWPLVPSGNLFNNWINSIIFLPIGFILMYRFKKI